jgi:hypothetical protein
MRHAILLLLFLAAPAFATTQLERTAIDALIAAKHTPTGKTNEHGGMIYVEQTESGPVFKFLEPTPEGSPTSVLVVDKSKLPPDAELVATYHLHLCMSGYYHAYFSTQDVIVTILTGLPEFMLDECTGEVHEFDSHRDKIHDTGIDAKTCGPNGEELDRHLPSGRIIGNIGETEVEHSIDATDDKKGC